MSPLVSSWIDPGVLWISSHGDDWMGEFHTDDVSLPLIWVVLLIGLARREICFNQSEVLPRSWQWHTTRIEFQQTFLRHHFAGKLVVVSLSCCSVFCHFNLFLICGWILFAVAIQIKRLLQNFCVLQLLFIPSWSQKNWNFCEVLQWPLWGLKWLTVSNLPHHYPTFGKKVTYRMQIKKLNNIVANLSHFL